MPELRPANRLQAAVGLAGQQPRVQVRSQLRLIGVHQPALAVAGEGAQSRAARHGPLPELGLVGIGDRCMDFPLDQGGEHRPVVVEGEERGARKVPSGDPLEVPAGVHPDAHTRSVQRVEVGMGMRVHDQGKRSALGGGNTEAARQRAFRAQRDAGHRHVEAPSGKRFDQLGPAKGPPFDLETAICRIAFCQGDFEPPVAAAGFGVCFAEGRVVAAGPHPNSALICGSGDRQ